MRAIKIDSENRNITEISISDVERMQLKDMQAVVGGYICLAFNFPDNKHSLFVDDDGLLNNPQFFFKHDFYPQPLAGNAIIVGMSLKGGETRECKLDIKEVWNRVQFYTLTEVQAFIREGSADYNTYITTSDGTREVYHRDLGAFDKGEK
jgi:hypothetical protein